jgi:hypothetical protein
MTDLSSKSCCVIDNGLFVELAIRLAREDGFGEVGYWSPYESAFPRWNEYDVGRGFPGVTRLDCWSQWIGKPDITWIFPDTYHRYKAEMLRGMGHAVWSAFNAEELELDREYGLDKMREAGINTPETTVVTGVTELKKHLKSLPKGEVVWIKSSFTRGEGETWKHENWEQSERHIDNKVVPNLGVNKEERVFLVTEDIRPAEEVGGDELTVDGQPFDHAMYGYEVKGVGYAAAFKPYGDLPAVVRDYDRKLSPVFKAAGARTFASSEIRVKRKGLGVAIDPCLRLGNPPVQAILEAYGNLPELIYHGARGEIKPVKTVAPYWYICMLESEEANESWTPIQMPEDVRRWVKLRFCCQVGGELGVIPQSQKVPMLGGAVGHGDTFDESAQMARDVADEVKAFGLIAHVREVETAKGYIEGGRKYGIEF